MKPLHIDFKPTKQLSALLVIMSAAMCAILIPLPFSWQIKLAVVVSVVISLSYAVAANCLLMLPWSCVALSVSSNNALKITLRDGTQLSDLAVATDTVVTPYLTVLRYQQKNAPFLRRVFKSSLIVMPDATDKESFRKLRVWLRWGVH